MNAQLQRPVTVRKPVVAGRFYPADREILRETVRHYLQKADLPELSHVRAVVAPHAGYVCSGSVAGYSFQALCSLPDAIYTVFLVGPAHWTPVDGVALTQATHFATPLGDVPIDIATCDRLLESGPPFHIDDGAHRPEHALEVALPFLQTVLPRLRIVPMLLQDACWSAQLGAALAPLLKRDVSTLVVVSSDLSHYRAYGDACLRDEAFLHAVVAGDVRAARPGEACGWPAILAVMTLAAQCGWTAHLLAYANSGDTCSDRRAVTGYGAIAYTAVQQDHERGEREI